MSAGGNERRGSKRRAKNVKAMSETLRLALFRTSFEGCADSVCAGACVAGTYVYRVGSAVTIAVVVYAVFDAAHQALYVLWRIVEIFGYVFVKETFCHEFVLLSLLTALYLLHCISKNIAVLTCSVIMRTAFFKYTRICQNKDIRSKKAFSYGS